MAARGRLLKKYPRMIKIAVRERPEMGCNGKSFEELLPGQKLRFNGEL